MDPRRSTISHLAEANQQLAAAHNFALTQLYLLFSSGETRGGGLCSKCRSNDTKTTMRTHASKRTKASNRRVRKLRKVAAIDETDEVDHHVSQALSNDEILRREIEELREEARTKTCDLEEQRILVRRLTEDFEESQRERDSKESQLRQVSQQLCKSEVEVARLVVELETFQCSAREEAEQTSRLRLRVAEQDEQTRKHVAAIDEANCQIRTLETDIEALNQAAKQSMEAASADSVDAEACSSSGVSEEFKKELTLKREARQRAIAAISSEMERLRRELEAEKCAHSETAKQLLELQATNKTDEHDSTNKTDSERLEARRLAELLKVSDELSSELWLQLERTDDLRFQLENDPDEHRLRINSLKRLSDDTRDKMRLRKQQLNVLKDRLAQIVVRLADRSFLEANDKLREEVERQVEDIARSRCLSDERSRILAELKDHCFKQVHELKAKLDSARKENCSLEEELHKTEDKMDAQDAEVLNLESQLGLAKADCRDLQNQMTLINSLFTQMLLSASSAEMDLDRLTRLLQENHDLISAMAKENCSEAAALPKLLMDIIEQVDGRNREADDKKEDEVQEENIAHNLPKVWRVLTELLSCHAAGGEQRHQDPSPSLESAPDSCYKSVDTPTGPRLVISVSKTYIRLKELILEKKHLEKEMNRMKQLNSHLENKLSEQEKRLSTVSDELSKTWNIVGRMQAQHQQLHTHEKILRYELQQKRKMLQELKKELEYCKEKWESARQKNNNTEMECRSLRREFAARKALATHSDSFNNSGESGFSDDREEESDEDDDDRVRPSTSRRRSKINDSRAETPETESELPTDNEFSEPKSSTSASGQRTPTPETEAELDNSEMVEDDTTSSTLLPRESRNEEEMIDPLEKALTNVLQNLIDTNELHRGQEDSLDFEDESDQVQAIAENLNKGATVNDKVEAALEKVESVIVNESPRVEAAIEKCDRVMENAIQDNIQSKMENAIGLDTVKEEVQNDVAKTEAKIVPVVSVFSIGPHPTAQVTVENLQFNNPALIRPRSSLAENREESSQQNKELASTSSSTEVIDARAARLRSLEEQAEWLVKKVNDTNRRGNALNSRLEELHETYGSMPVAPPMPDVLPTFRIRTVADELNDQPNDHNVHPTP